MTEYLTDAGKEMLSRMLAGKVTINFTKIQIGDGELKTSQAITSMTGLVNTVKTLDIQSVELSEENIVTIKAIFDNTDLTEGFYFKEKGVWASDGQNEVLFAYGNARSTAQFINSATVELIEKQIISIYKTLQDVNTPINIKVKSGIYAKQEDLEKTQEQLQDQIDEIKNKENSSGSADASLVVRNGVLCFDYDEEGIQERYNYQVVDDELVKELQSAIKTTETLNNKITELESSKTILTETLTAGQTTITIQDDVITADCMIDVYVNIYGVTPEKVTVSNGSIVLMFEKRASDMQVKVVIMNDIL